MIDLCGWTTRFTIKRKIANERQETGGKGSTLPQSGGAKWSMGYGQCLRHSRSKFDSHIWGHVLLLQGKCMCSCSTPPACNRSTSTSSSRGPNTDGFTASRMISSVLFHLPSALQYSNASRIAWFSSAPYMSGFLSAAPCMSVISSASSQPPPLFNRFVMFGYIAHCHV